MQYLILIISAVFINNIVFVKTLGMCPYIGVSTKIETALGMSSAVMFVMVLSGVATYLMQKFVLIPLGITFMRTITFILVIAFLVQMVEIILKKVSPSLYQALGIFLPLITTNCIVLGVAVMAVDNNYNLLQSVVYNFANALGFGLALTLMAGIREQLDLVNIPKGINGVPIALIIAGILALAFMGFTGIV